MATGALILLVLFKHAGGGDAIGAAMAMADRVEGIDVSGLRLFPVALFLYYAVTINLLLFVFNLFPIPPLDGSHVLRNFLPYEAEKVYDKIGMYGLIVIFLLGGRFIAAFYYPLLGVFNSLLAVL
jgi:Zn-dependent protease